MTKKILTLFVFFFALTMNAQERKEPIKAQIVEAACGQCQFGMEGKGCDLAVRIGKTTYFVEGTSMDQHGDAHAHDGLCNTVRKAQVSGEIVDNKFKATAFQLLDEKRAVNK